MTNTRDMTEIDLSGYEPGFDIPALPGMTAAEVQTPCLILDLDALEHNISTLGAYARSHHMRHRAHAKMHKSVDVARLQQRIGGAVGVCCQKVSEAEVFARAGIDDILVSNEVRDPAKIDRLARLPHYGGQVSLCVDDIDAVADLSAAATRHGTELGVLVEVECGGARCGVGSPTEAVALARAIHAAPGLRYAGVQAYHGAMQHIPTAAGRELAFAGVARILRPVIAALKAADLAPQIVSGGGTGSFHLESASSLFNELQCGSYAFMDADYGRIEGPDARRMDIGTWQNALFVLTSVISRARPGHAVCDAGLKVLSLDSGPPVIFGREDVTYRIASDEHGVIADPQGVLRINQHLRLVPGHCDPTCNLHDWYVGLRGDVVESVWPVSARGRAY